MSEPRNPYDVVEEGLERAATQALIQRQKAQLADLQRQLDEANQDAAAWKATALTGLPTHGAMQAHAMSLKLKRAE